MRYLFTAVFLVATNASYAFFCPENFSQVYEGDTMDKVMQTCGMPHSQKSESKKASLSEEWTYFTQKEATNKPIQMTVVIANSKVVNIKLDRDQTNMSWGGGQPLVNVAIGNQAPMNVASIGACGTTINVGDAAQRIESFCGKPVAIKQNEAPGAQNGADITLFIYGGANAATFVFENGLLKGRL